MTKDTGQIMVEKLNRLEDSLNRFEQNLYSSGQHSFKLKPGAKGTATSPSNIIYEQYCGYCDSKIFSQDRTCPRCGAPTKNYVVKEAVYSGKKIDQVQKQQRYKDFEKFFPYSDIRIIDKGDSQCFSLEPRDVFCILKNKENANQAESYRKFSGQVAISTNLNSFNGSDISNIFSCAIKSISEPTEYFRCSNFSTSNLVVLFQKVSAYNNGRRSVIVGTMLGLMNILPPDPNYRYFLGEPGEMTFIKSVFGIDAIALPQALDYKNPFSLNLSNDRIWIVSPTEGKLVKIVSEDDSFKRVGVGVGFSSIYGTIEV